MAIGIGVLSNFNGNDRDTIIAIGTLDALSAGILVWVAVVEMWAEDWLRGHGELLRTSPTVTFLAGSGLVAGMVIMSVLGKWASTTQASPPQLAQVVTACDTRPGTLYWKGVGRISVFHRIMVSLEYGQHTSVMILRLSASIPDVSKSVLALFRGPLLR